MGNLLPQVARAVARSQDRTVHLPTIGSVPDDITVIAQCLSILLEDVVDEERNLREYGMTRYRTDFCFSLPNGAAYEGNFGRIGTPSYVLPHPFSVVDDRPWTNRTYIRASDYEYGVHY